MDSRWTYDAPLWSSDDEVPTKRPKLSPEAMLQKVKLELKHFRESIGNTLAKEELNLEEAIGSIIASSQYTDGYDTAVDNALSNFRKRVIWKIRNFLHRGSSSTLVAQEVAVDAEDAEDMLTHVQTNPPEDERAAESVPQLASTIENEAQSANPDFLVEVSENQTIIVRNYMQDLPSSTSLTSFELSDRSIVPVIEMQRHLPQAQFHSEDSLGSLPDSLVEFCRNQNPLEATGLSNFHFSSDEGENSKPEEWQDTMTPGLTAANCTGWIPISSTGADFFSIVWGNEYRKLRDDENKLIYVCRACSITLSRKVNMEDHIWAGHYQGKYMCCMCHEYQAGTRVSIKGHYKMDHPLIHINVNT